MKKFFFDIICKFSFEIDTDCFIPSFPESKLTDSFDLASKLLFGEEVEGSDRSGGQCGDMEMIGSRTREMTTMTRSLNKSNLLSRFIIGSIENDK
ncbi:hypothetical protein Ahy_A02g007600 [Arachis hypogaea]|uniref:Uncharacterized protein n=1 Tax=Arachis hypogaea TaxID=3818 RepID=A0A445ED41_ARAHY|nr:hypothetical protein Ahy_A02g007600 [Arachis hypogaea]